MLLKHQKEYWKKRYTITWTKFGDENTQKIHAAATERYRLNTITSLETEDGGSVYEHSEKASMLLQEYNHRMGCTTNPTMLFDLTQLVQTSDSLDEMSKPFSIDDIDSVIKQMPVDKALVPDGLMGFFLKSCKR